MSNTESKELPVHILRSAEIHVFERIDSNRNGAQYVAKFYTYSRFPIIFKGNTYRDVMDSITAFREEQLAIHEQGFLVRSAAAKMRKHTRTKNEPSQE